MVKERALEHYEYAVVGAGPAGLQLGYFLAKRNLSYIILEAADGAGAFFRTFPRHRKLISINKVYCGTSDPKVQFRWDWNSLLNDEEHLFKDYSKEYFPTPEDMIAYLRDFADRNRLNIRYSSPVREIEKAEGAFTLLAGGNRLAAQTVVIATGVSEPFVPAVDGIEHAVHYATFDPDPRRYTDRSVLIIGKGNSGFETADSLVPFASKIHIVSPSNLRMAWNTHHVGHLRAVNNNLVDTDRLKGQNATIWGEVRSIERTRNRYLVRISHTDSAGRMFSHIYDHIICCTGFRMALAPFGASATPELAINERFPKLTERWESTNVSGLFFAGTLTQSRDFKRSSSAFIHGFRYNAHALFNILMKRRGEPWPSETISRDCECITNALMRRVNTTSSLWHQFDFMADVIDITCGDAVYYCDVPAQYALTDGEFASKKILLLTFTHDKPRDPELHRNFSQVPALHPRLVYVERGEFGCEHHMLEDLEAEWFEEGLYIAPLEDFVRSVLQQHGPYAGPPPSEAVRIMAS